MMNRVSGHNLGVETFDAGEDTATASQRGTQRTKGM